MQAFVGADSGYQAVAVAGLESGLDASLPASDSVFPASGQLSPLAKAMLLVEAEAGTLPRTRHHLSVRVENFDAPPPNDPGPVLFVQLDRYNLGPAIRAELVANAGADNVAPEAEFGEGPHVSWRFVMQRLMGHEAALIAAGFMQLDGAALEEASPAAGSLADCLGIPCLSTTGGIDEVAVWQEMEAAAPDPSGLPYQTLAAGLPSAAALLDLATQEPPFDPYGAELFGQGRVVAEFVIETGLAQEAVIDLAFRQGDLPDDSVAAVWQRLLAFSTGAGEPAYYRSQAFECRRGDSGWAPMGGFCL